MSNDSNTEEENQRQREESPDMPLLDNLKTPGNVFDESQFERLCKKFVKLLEKFIGSERYPQVGTFQEQQPN